MTVAHGRLWPAGIISPPWAGAPAALTPHPFLPLRLGEESGNSRDLEVILGHKSQGLLEVENPLVASQGPRAGGAHRTCKAQRVFE